MTHPKPPDPLDLIPDPSEIHNRIAAAARTQRLLRRLLRLSVSARREQEARETTGISSRTHHEQEVGRG